MKTTENQNQDGKQAAYPYYDLEACIKFAEHIKNLGGAKGAIKKSLLAKQVGLAESTPSFFQRISACKVFHIIDGWGSYGLTELGTAYFYPQSEKGKQEALLEIFNSPEAFHLIVSRFDGEKLPTNDIIGNILHQELSIPDSWKDRVAQFFVRSAHFAGITDSGGFLRYRAAVHTLIPAQDDANQAESQATQSQQVDTSKGVSVPVKPAAGTNVWTYGNSIRLQTPDPLSKELWEKLNAYVQHVLKASE